MVTMVVTLRLDYTQNVDEQADASRALANASYQALTEISDELEDKIPDFEDIEGRLRELRYLNYTSDGQIPAGGACFTQLIEVLHDFARKGEEKILRAKEADTPVTPTLVERADGELEPYSVNIERSLKNIKSRVELWRTTRKSPRYFFHNLPGSGYADRAFGRCLQDPAEDTEG